MVAESLASIGEAVAVAPNGDIVFPVTHRDSNIWAMKLNPPGEPAPLIASTKFDGVAQFSPDGRHLVFVSSRSGAGEVWTAESNGANPRQVTTIGGVGSPSWSPDGAHIVFDSNASGGFEVYTVLVSGGAPRRLTNHAANDGVASYSRDGRSIYLGSRRSGERRIWRMNTDGSGVAPVTAGRGHAPIESFDGKLLYYFKSNAIWRIPVSGGEEVEVLQGINGFLDFAIARDGIYFVPEKGVPGARGQREILFFDFATKSKRKIVEIGNGTLPGRVAISPDGNTLVWGQTDTTGSDLMLMRRLAH